jgi:hypothetical protein
MHARRWIAGSVMAMVMLTSAQACYEYVPMETAAPVGQLVELKITDPGRVNLAPRFGPGLDVVTGRLVSQQQSDVTVSVFSVTNLDGENTRWSGEAVQLDRGFIRSVKGRRISPMRTAVLATAAAVVLYFTAGRSLTGGGKDPRDPPDPIDPPASTRIPMGLRLRVIP